jgi:integrase
MKDLRDHSILLLGFAGAFRRSELVVLDVTDLEFCDGGLRVHIRRSKTDQEGAGDTIAIAPARLPARWRRCGRGLEPPISPPVRCSGQSPKAVGLPPAAWPMGAVARVVKASARRVGLDPKLFAGHSLRSGFLTSAAGRGASIFKMMDVSRHKSMDTLRGYVRDAELFRDHAGAGLL